MKQYAKKKFFSKERYNNVNSKQHTIKKKYMDALKTASLKIDSYVDKGVLDVFFSDEKERYETHTKNEPLLLVRQKKYIHLFLIMYFTYLNKLIERKLPAILGNNWKDKYIACNITMEKVILDHVFGSKDNFIIKSNILFKTSNRKKVRLITRGEGLLPAIQHRLNLKLALKKYFVVAQLNPTYIQITLHKVVKVASTSEYSSTIIIHDKIIQIENVVDTICKCIWEHTRTTGTINHCTSRENEGLSSRAIFSLKSLADVLEKIKVYVLEIVSSYKKKTQFYFMILNFTTLFLSSSF